MTIENPRARRRAIGDGGAVLVEFAIIVPIFFLLVFAVVEFGWAYFQQIDVRHGAREGARLAAVDYQSSASPSPATQAAEIVAETCSRMDSGDNVSVTLTQVGTSAVGQKFEVVVSKPLDQITGFLGPFLNGITLTSSVDSRIEQQASWTSTTGAVACP